MGDFRSFFGEETCLVCFDPEHPDGPCQANDIMWLDPAVGGSPTNTPRICGCDESVNLQQRNAIVVRIDRDNPAVTR